jgi:hypothetical protein
MLVEEGFFFQADSREAWVSSAQVRVVVWNKRVTGPKRQGLVKERMGGRNEGGAKA